MKKKDEKSEKTSSIEIKLNKLELNISEILTEISNQNADVEFNPDDPFSNVNPPKLTLQYFFWKDKALFSNRKIHINNYINICR